MIGSFVSPATRQRIRDLAVPVARGLGRLGLTPNALTVLGFLGTCAAAGAAAGGEWLAAGILVLGFGAFDLLDGALARATGRVSRFGAFLDSTLDRTGEGLVLAGCAIGCAILGFVEGVVLAVLALAFASVVTYARAKAEVIGLHGETGFAPREVRVVLLSAGLVLAGLLGGVGWFPVPAGQLRVDDPLRAGSIPLLIALGLIATLSAITIVQRIVHVREQLNHDQ